jgi:hypothetical protein
MKIFANKLMERYFLGERSASPVPDRLKSTFLSRPFFEMQDCVFFDYLAKPEIRSGLNFHRYGNRTRCEASVNGFHVKDFCDKKEMAIPAGFAFLYEFIKKWKANSNEKIVIYFGVTPREEEFGPDVTFSFHKKRENETWMNLESIENIDGVFMAIEV